MKQVLFAGSSNNLKPDATAYSMLGLGMNWNTTEADIDQMISTPGKIRDLRVELSAAPGAGKSYTFTLRVNGADTALTCAISDTDTSNEDTTHEVTVSAGDKVALKCTPSASPALATALWTSIFVGGQDRESLIFCRGRARPTEAITWLLLSGWIASAIATETQVRELVSTPGAIQSVYIELSQSPGTSPDAYRFTLRKNGADTDIVITITAPDTTGSDTTHSVSVAAGDYLAWKVEPLNGPTNIIYADIGTTFFADTDGESLMLGTAGGDPLSPNSTEYAPLIISSTLDWGAELGREKLGQNCALKNLHVLLSASPGAGKSRTFIVRRNGADTSLVVTISDTDVVGSNIVNNVSIADGDVVTLKHLPASSPNLACAYWGVTQYAAGISLPTVQTNPATLIEMESAQLNGELTDDGGETCDCNFEWGLTEAYGDETPLQEWNSPVTFWDDLASLNPATIYNFRAKAENQAGVAYGDNEEFCTLGGYAYWM